MRVVSIRYAALSLLIAMFALAAMSASAWAGKRVALIIGNSAYEHAPELANPRNDAADFAAKLAELEFEVIVRQDAKLSEMLSAVEEFSDKLHNAELSLFYYAGHGLQVDGRNYLVPVGAKLESHITLDYEAVPVDLVMATMQSRSKTNLLFLDACRNNPLARSLARSLGTRSTAVGRGLARIGAGTGTFISFATEPGNVALDGQGDNSPYTEALVRHFGTPGKGLAETMVLVRKDVIESTGGKQVPWEHSSLTGSVVLKEIQQIPDQTRENDRSVVITFWDSIQNTNDPAFYEAYLRRFPDGAFAEIAKLTVERLRAASSGPQSSQSAPNASTQESARQQASLTETNTPDTQGNGDSEDADARKDRQLVRAIQTELNRLGCETGRPDGVWGKRTEKGLGDFTRHAGQDTATPGPELLALLETRTGRVCPLVCGTGEVEADGRCVAVQSAGRTTSDGEGQSAAGCLKLSVRVARTDYLGRTWDVEEGVGPAPDVIVEESGSGFRSSVCQDSYTCTFKLQRKSPILKLRFLDNDPHVKTRGPELIGSGQCPARAGECNVGKANVKISPC